MPGDGRHSIQVFLNDSLGVISQSDIRYFSVNITIDTTKPVITINSPNFNTLFGSSAPFFNITIIEPNLKSIWYTIDLGLTNITIVGEIGIIDQAVWNNAPNGTINIQFYADDELNNIGFAQVNVRKDILAPNIIINSPSQNEILPEAAPDFDLTILDGNLDTIWYTLDGGIINTITSSPMGTISQFVWDYYLNETVTIRFYANDTLGHIGFQEVIIRKDILAPVIIINLPEEFQRFSDTAPTFNLSITDGNLDLNEIYYSINGLFNLSCDKSGQIDQNLWNALSPGSYTLQFYAKDILGHVGFAQVIIIKRGKQIYDTNIQDPVGN